MDVPSLKKTKSSHAAVHYIVKITTLLANQRPLQWQQQ